MICYTYMIYHMYHTPLYIEKHPSPYRSSSDKIGRCRNYPPTRLSRCRGHDLQDSLVAGSKEGSLRHMQLYGLQSTSNS